ncbi:Uncharacterised protein [Escherichia coli]|nr:Uncharacterised protein [Escherichia coli]
MKRLDNVAVHKSRGQFTVNTAGSFRQYQWIGAINVICCKSLKSYAGGIQIIHCQRDNGIRRSDVLLLPDIYWTSVMQ